MNAKQENQLQLETGLFKAKMEKVLTMAIRGRRPSSDEWVRFTVFQMADLIEYCAMIRCEEYNRAYNFQLDMDDVTSSYIPEKIRTLITNHVESA